MNSARNAAPNTCRKNVVREIIWRSNIEMV
jgi:hypothetical protein